VAVPTASRLAGQERHPFSALPLGWAVIGRCRFGTGGPGAQPTGCYALAHPEVGVALLDIAPHATPNAEARLRRALTAAEFWPDYPGTLPVLHDRLEATALRSLPWVLEQGFAALPDLTVPGGTAWMEGVRRAMAADPAWELPGQPKAMPAAPPAASDDLDPDTTAAPPRRFRMPRWGRFATLPLAFIATFALGLVAGFLLLDSPGPVAQPPAVGAALPPQAAAVPTPPAPAATSEAPPRPAASTATTPEAPPRVAEPTAAPAAAVPPATPAAAAPPSASPAAPAAGAPPAAPVGPPARPTAEAAAGLLVGASPAPVAASTSPTQAGPRAAEVSSPAPAAAETPAGQNGQQATATGPAENGGNSVAPATAGSPLETRVSMAAPVADVLPMAPPRAPAPPVRVSSPPPSARTAPVIDRACSQALFRFQQGERLTAAEQNFIRTGCGTGRR
jgi:hypothetical protein